MLNIHPENPQGSKIDRVVEELKEGGVMIYPTDSVYAYGCDFANHDAVDKICKLKGMDPAKANLTFICKDISQISDYTAQFDTEIFRVLKRNLPGPYTFILRSNNTVPKLFKNKKRTVGVRIPDNKIVLEIVEKLGRPILSTSLKTDEDIIEYYTDPERIKEKYENQVDFIVNGGIGNNEPSTVVDATGDELVIVREGIEPLK
jgi:tRNA threonylcarbamoyl adenosine modification protein (Sua5/YciO/YrdC/YwlC family)